MFETEIFGPLFEAVIFKILPSSRIYLHLMAVTEIWLGIIL